MIRFIYICFAILALSFATATSANAIEIQRVKSPGGIEAWLIEDHSLPIISISFSFDAGKSMDPSGKEGLGEFTAAMLDEGAGSFNSTAFQEKLDELAGSIGFDSGDDYFSGSARTLTGNKDAVFDLLRAALENPRFEKSDISRVRQQFHAVLRQKDQDPETKAHELWVKNYFSGHPYARFYTANSIDAITPADFRAFMKSVFNRNTLKIGVSGDIDPASLGIALDRIFGFIPAFPSAVKPANFEPNTQPKTGIIQETQAQTVAVFGQPGVKRDNPDFYPLYVLNHILGGGGFSSYLTKIVRDEHGLAYSVYTSVATMRDGGIILGGVATNKDSFAQSLQLVKDTWQNFPEKLTESDVDAAKKYLLGSFPLRFSSTSQIAGILLTLQQDNLGIDFFDKRNDIVRNVSFQDVKRAAEKFLRVDQLSFAIVGDYQTPNQKPE